MTTAHRPTFDTARGGTGRNEKDLSKLAQQYSSKDMPSHTKLKYRQTGQAATEDVRSKDFRRELTDRERNSRRTTASRDSASTSSAGKKQRLDQIPTDNLDADDPVDEDDSDSDDEDDTAELMAELNRIKKERAAEAAKREAVQAAEEEQIRTENILSGNPLLSGGPADKKTDFKVKRRWDDDVVFKNCAKGLDERAGQASFVNDSIRSEFHKKFMDKYIV